MAASPLFIGGDLPTMDNFSLGILTNPDMLACNQNGVMGVHVFIEDDIEVYHTKHKDDVGKGWIGIFNRNEFDSFIGNISRKKLGLLKQINGYKIVEIEKAVKCKDIWNNQKIEITSEGIRVNIPPDDVLFLYYEVAN